METELVNSLTIVTEDEVFFTLKYYLQKDTQGCYNVRIEKYDLKEHGLVLDEVAVTGELAPTYEAASATYYLLYQGSVPPCALADVMADLLAEEEMPATKGWLE